MSAKKRSLVLAMIAVVCAVSLAGCCSLGLKSCSTSDRLVLVGAKDLNNCNDTSSIPVAVRIYYLRQKDAFLKSSFDELWRDPEGTLGSDIAGSKRSATVTPGGEVQIDLVRPADAAYVGIITDFCRDAGAWHKVIELDSKGLRKIVKLNQVHLSVED